MGSIVDWFVSLANFAFGLFLGAVLAILAQAILKRLFSARAYFLVRFAKLYFSAAKIPLTAKRSVRIRIPPRDSDAEVDPLDAFWKATMTTLRAHYDEVELRGETAIRAISRRNKGFELHVDIERATLPAQRSTAIDIPMAISTKCTAPFRRLANFLTVGLAELEDAIAGLPHVEGLSLERADQVSLTISLERAPAVLAALSRLKISELRTEREDYKIDLSPSEVRFRGHITDAMAQDIRDLVTWYY